MFFHGTHPVAAFEKLQAEAVVWKCSIRKVFIEISQESTYAGVLKP